MLQFRMQAGPDFLFILLDIQHLYELPPVYEGLRLKLAVIQQQVDLFGGQGYVEGAEGLLEHEVGYFSTFLFVDFGEDLLKRLGTGGKHVLEVVDLVKARGTNLVHWSSIFSFSAYSCSLLLMVVPLMIEKS